jgi:hypothetical protein
MRDKAKEGLILHDAPKPDPQPKKISAGKAEWRAHVETCRAQKNVDDLINGDLKEADQIKAEVEDEEFIKELTKKVDAETAQWMASAEASSAALLKETVLIKAQAEARIKEAESKAQADALIKAELLHKAELIKEAEMLKEAERNAQLLAAEVIKKTKLVKAELLEAELIIAAELLKAELLKEAELVKMALLMEAQLAAALLREEELLRAAELLKDAELKKAELAAELAAELINDAELLKETVLIKKELLMLAQPLKAAVIIKEEELLTTKLYLGKLKSERQASPKSHTLWESIPTPSNDLDPLWILTLYLSRSHPGFPRILHLTPPDPILDPPKDPPKDPINITLWIPPDLTLGNPGSNPSWPSTRTAITSVGAQLHSIKLV